MAYDYYSKCLVCGAINGVSKFSVRLPIYFDNIEVYNNHIFSVLNNRLCVCELCFENIIHIQDKSQVKIKNFILKFNENSSYDIDSEITFKLNNNISTIYGFNGCSTRYYNYDRYLKHFHRHNKEVQKRLSKMLDECNKGILNNIELIMNETLKDTIDLFKAKKRGYFFKNELSRIFNCSSSRVNNMLPSDCSFEYSNLPIIAKYIRV